MSFFSFLFFFYPKLQFSIAILLHMKRTRCGGAHFFTSSQAIRVTFQSRQSNIEAAQMYFLIQRADFCKKVNELVELVEN